MRVSPSVASVALLLSQASAFSDFSGSSAQAGDTRWDNGALDSVTGQGPTSATNTDRDRHGHVPENTPVISGQRAEMRNRYSNSFSVFNGAVPRPTYVPPYNDGSVSSAQHRMETKPRQQPTHVVKQSAPTPVAATAVDHAKAAPQKLPQQNKPVMAGTRAEMSNRYGNSFSAFNGAVPQYASPHGDGSVRPSEHRIATTPKKHIGTQAVKKSAPTPVTPAVKHQKTEPQKLQQNKPVMSGTRAEMSNRYSNSFSAFNGAVPQYACDGSVRPSEHCIATTPREHIGTQAVKKSAPTAVAPAVEHQKIEPQKLQQNKPVMSGTLAEMNNRYSNSFSAFNGAAPHRIPTLQHSQQPKQSSPTMAASTARTTSSSPMAHKRIIIQSKPTTIEQAGNSETEAGYHMVEEGNDIKAKKSDAVHAGESVTAPAPTIESIRRSTPSKLRIIPKCRVPLMNSRIQDPSGDSTADAVTNHGPTPGSRIDARYGNSVGKEVITPIISGGAVRAEDRYGNSLNGMSNGRSVGASVQSSVKSSVRRPSTGEGSTTRTVPTRGVGTPLTAPLAPSAGRHDINVQSNQQTQQEESAGSPPPPKAIVSGARTEDRYGNSLNQMGNGFQPPPPPARKKAPLSPAPSVARRNTNVQTTGKRQPERKEASGIPPPPRAIVSGARTEDRYGNSLNQMGNGFRPPPPPARPATKAAKRVPAPTYRNQGNNMSHDNFGCCTTSGSSATNEDNRYGNSHHIYGSHVHAALASNVEPLEKSDRILTKSERKWVIP